MTMGGISAGRRFITDKVASVPPVEAPRPMITRSMAVPPSLAAGTTGAGAVVAGKAERTRALEAVTTFWARAAMKLST